jgi:hypothetical protein
MTAGFEIGDRWVNNHTGDVARMTECQTIIITTDEHPFGKGVHIYTLTYEDESLYARNALKHQYSHVFRCDEQTLRKHWSCLVANEEE